MDLLFVLQLLRNILKELWLHKYLSLFSGIAIAFSILMFGYLWQEKYQVSTTLYADSQNIIQPLLEGQAQVTRVEDKSQVVKDLMLSQRAMEKIIIEQGFLSENDNAATQAEKISDLRDDVNVSMLGKNYIGVSFSDTNPDRAYNVITHLVDYFIRESSATKRSESKQAFLFIEKQSNAYKEQLRLAEEKLKQFKATNLDGTESSVAAKVEDLRTSISDIELNLEQATSRVDSLVVQVKKEDRYLTKKAKADQYKERIAEAVARLDNLRLSLTDNHPDVNNLRQHISGLYDAVENPSASSGSVSNSVGSNETPVYDELRAQLAAAQVEKDAIEKRLKSMKVRLSQEYARAKRVAERNAESSELTRDYDVTKRLYEDLLGRKEKARLSMTLDIEGQGVTYKIQEPAKYPLNPSGLRFIHFVILGCLAAVIVPVGLAGVYVFLDPRIRFPDTLHHVTDVPVLGVVPHMISNPVLRVRDNDIKFILSIIFLAASLYFGLVAYFVLWSS
ncbi:MAG: chain length-determining protein [Cellvibrionales bacterium]|nr:chain length-determining protein [Cellvibrionales bacterium]